MTHKEPRALRAVIYTRLDPVAVDRGREIVAEALLGGHGCAFGLTLATAAAPAEMAPALLRGALFAACDVLDAAQRRGVRMSVARVDHVAAASFLLHGAARRAALANVPDNYALRAIQCVFSAADALMPYLRREGESATAAPPPPAPAPVPQTINLELALKLPAGPLPVAIVSQPDTVSTTAVERKADGRIGNTTTYTHSV